ncbi:uncharacterized protein LOC129879391 [Solanum dulcamara]|uniref:uncharacterized protein LOC129879391 n=1 Tax=Solanum dulcamara TaxID=45834 RepID=UPI002485C4C0|nr:uncharacterized protein LOC129879391 [Solanum dulcamara]
MNQEKRCILIALLNLYVFCFILQIDKCFAVDPQFVACNNPINCRNGPRISFPFYIQEEQESYCGYPGFGLNCSEQGFPVVHIAGNEYIVEDISYQDHIFQIKNSVFNSTTSNGCVSYIKNVSLDHGTFKFVNESRIYLLSKCNGSISENLLKHKIGFGCGEENGNDWALAMFAEDESFESALQVCKHHVIAPVEMLGDEGSNRDLDYQVLLRRGFRLSWTSSNCSECAESGGHCGFDIINYQFKCFCTDRPHSWSCPPTKAKRNLGLILGIVFPCIGVVILLFCLRKKIFWHKNLRFWESKAEDHRNIEAFLKNYGSYAPNRYNYTDIKRITSHFKNKLGQGGFGNVYRGSLRNGSQVAVKVLNELKGNGEDFINEVASISRTSHVNIVSLVGFCFEGRKRALVYEFMPNGSLEKFIYEERSDGVRQLGWPILYKIALGIARGSEYLHCGCNTRILHFDIKPHNILLDEDFCPKISDFGLAKLCIKKESVVSMLGPRGTIGYIAPEIVCRNLGGVSHKSDVYSYGMMVLEMVGGRKNVDVGVDRTSEIYFPHWLYQRIELDEELQLIGIMNEEEKECARKMVMVSLWCIQTDPSNRPSMSKVVEMLEGKLDSLQMPPKPYLYSPSGSEVDSSIIELTKTYPVYLIPLLEIFNMAITSFVSFLLFLLLILVQAKGSRNDSTCPKSFSCGNFTDLRFPYSLSTQPHCGIMTMNGCDAKPFPKIRLIPEGDWYYALEKHNSSVWLGDTKLETTLTQHKCQAFNKNFSLPNSPSISFNMININNFFKCISTSNNALNITHKTNGYFAGYKMYSGCEGFSIYYNLFRNSDEYIEAYNLPTNCSIIRLPIQSSDGDLFDVLGPEILVEWKLSDDCISCHYGGGQCQTDKTNRFSCHKDVRKNIGVTDVSNLTQGKSKRGYLRIIWFMVATGASLFTVGLLVLLFCFREKILWYKYIRFWLSNAEDHQKVEEFLKNYGSYAPNRYNYTDIKRITSHFKNKLGQGGFGNVYRGSLRNGSEVAVKVLNERKGSAEDFINEVASISRTSHVNIVSLVGFCFEGHKRALVYEFMPNGSLENFIYEERSDSVRQLSWPILYKIALGIARGLEYLHRGCNTRILHFDIKPHNILLDDNFCPKISDFGLAKLCMKQESIVSMLGPRGTIGYIAPEIVCRNLGGVSHKSDVYSYGMMVLEMVGGRKNVDVGVDRTSEIYFPHWLYRRIELDEELQLIGIMNEEDNECARKLVIVSLWCIQTDPSNRPSMSKVVEMLEGKLDSLQMPPKPYLYSPSSTEVDSSVVELA